jgi:hypothetical protein
MTSGEADPENPGNPVFPVPLDPDIAHWAARASTRTPVSFSMSAPASANSMAA